MLQMLQEVEVDRLVSLVQEPTEPNVLIHLLMLVKLAQLVERAHPLLRAGRLTLAKSLFRTPAAALEPTRLYRAIRAKVSRAQMD